MMHQARNKLYNNILLPIYLVCNRYTLTALVGWLWVTFEVFFVGLYSNKILIYKFDTYVYKKPLVTAQGRIKI